MFVRPKKRWLRVELNAGLFKNLTDRGIDQGLALMNTSRRHLGSRLGMVPMVEDEQSVIAFDVNDHSLSERHRRMVSGYDGSSLAWASVREMSPDGR